MPGTSVFLDLLVVVEKSQCSWTLLHWYRKGSRVQERMIAQAYWVPSLAKGSLLTTLPLSSSAIWTRPFPIQSYGRLKRKSPKRYLVRLCPQCLFHRRTFEVFIQNHIKFDSIWFHLACPSKIEDKDSGRRIDPEIMEEGRPGSWKTEIGEQEKGELDREAGVCLLRCGGVR